ncbi:MAG: CRISPR-associated protein Csx11 [Bryobacteraceae bacterium]|nr:CRISPR-associated protein Csx11 [Bryobacteraceae bacterium]MDW8379094.1 CRISPR-associated protein Csx11 [Bryobacterales bacterium]
MIKKLRENRALLLACEAIGWLHMTGKAHPDFLRRHGSAGVSYKPEDWYKTLMPAWSDRLAWLRSSNSGMPLPDSFTEFLEKYDAGQSENSLVGFLQAAHAMASGIEKNLPSSTSAYLGQDITHMWLASPFGHPVRNLLADPPPVLAPGAFDSLLNRIGKLLDDLHTLAQTAGTDVHAWWQWREAATGPDGWLREAFLSTLAETRLPNNDVTLWDQSYVAAALFKSAVAGALLAGCNEWSNLKQQTRWRVLTIGLGSRHYEARAVKIGDWVGARRDIDGFFKQVRRLIEVDLALGSLIFQEDETLAFTFPGLRSDATCQDSKGSLDDTCAESLRREMGAEVEQIAQARKLETPPLTLLSESTRSFIGMVEQLRKARETLAIPLHRTWAIPEPGTAGGHVCPVCQVRFNQPHTNDQTENARKQRVCAVCADRRKGRLDAWLDGEGDTIWISEVADSNDRVALLSFNLDIEAWIGGDHVDSLRAQSILDWRRFNATLDNRDNPIDLAKPFVSLVEYVRAKLSNFDKNDPVLRSLQEGYRYESNWASFFSKIVEDRSGAPEWGQLDDDARARWIVHQLFRKLPSPGRIHRFWRAAEIFFDDLFVRFREIAAAYPNRWRTRRLVLEPDNSKGGWEDRETYAERLGDAPFEVLYRNDIGRFVTICNLARCLDADKSERSLKGRSVKVKGDDGQTRTFTIRRVGTPDKIAAYAPVIPLERSPQRFRVLVPLECASACIETAMKKWEEEFGRVWDRMPIRTGVVAFPRMTPFHGVIESARNLEADLTEAKPEVWRLQDRRTKDGVTALMLVRSDRVRETVLMPTALPDGRDDVFYPYFRVEDRELRDARDFSHPDGTVYRHAAALRPGDGVVVYPSCITAVFLDATARRFEKGKLWHLSDFRRMRDTWDLLAQVAPSLGALRGAWAELEERLVAWRNADGSWVDGADQEWIELARAVLSDRLGVSGAALEHLVETSRDGILEWAIEWHLSWLKLGMER